MAGVVAGAAEAGAAGAGGTTAGAAAGAGGASEKAKVRRLWQQGKMQGCWRTMSVGWHSWRLQVLSPPCLMPGWRKSLFNGVNLATLQPR